MIFNKKLVEIRKYHGLKQKELAAILGIGEDMMSKYEREVHAVPDELKIAIAEHFGVSLDYFFGLIDDPVSYNKKDVLALPKGFPEETKHELKDYIRFKMQKR